MPPAAAGWNSEFHEGLRLRGCVLLRVCTRWCRGAEIRWTLAASARGSEGQGPGGGVIQSVGVDPEPATFAGAREER
jgi:hypothetical protein